jgi:hypothetical protein
MPYEPPPHLASLSLAQVAEQVASRKLPPLASWNPQQSGDSKMQIMRDGRWFHDGGEIKRPAMIRAFASLLTRDKTGQHWLVTPFEKLTIEVEDAAFIATDCQAIEDGLAFHLNSDDLVVAGPDNPIMARGDAEAPALYVAVRNGCEARLNRSTYEQLANIALAKPFDKNAGANEAWTVASQGARFSLIPA